MLEALRSHWILAILLAGGWALSGTPLAAKDAATRRPIDELKPIATIRVGKTADWVAVTPDAVWVGSTGPDAVHRIDPKTNALVASVTLNGEPCAGLSAGLGSLWVPLCGSEPTLAKVDLASNALTGVFKIGPPVGEGGVAVSADSVWLVTDKNGTLARIDPATGAVRQSIRVPAGSYNPTYRDGDIWVSRADGSEVTRVDAKTGAVLASVRTGPGPRFLTSGAGAIWTLNQGDGSLTRVDVETKKSKTIALDTPGHGGDVAFGGDMIWTTMMKAPLSMIDAATVTLRCQWTGAGGDSLSTGHGSIWLTDYHGGTISRIDMSDAMSRCRNR